MTGPFAEPPAAQDVPDVVLLPATRDVTRLLRTERQGTPSTAHHLGSAVRIGDPVTRERLTEVLAGLADRHAALRTAIVQDAVHGPRFEVRRRPAGTLLRWSAAGEDVDVDGRLRELMEPPFDLATSPLWRFEMLETPSGDQMLVFGAHHAVCDAQSLMLVVAELGAELSGVRPAAPASNRDVERLLKAQPANPPRDPAETTRRRREAFAGCRRLDLASDRPARRSFRAGTLFLEMPGELLDRLTSQAKRFAVTPAALCLGTLAVFLGRSRGPGRFVLAVPVDTRMHVRAPEALGFFGVPVPLVAQVDADDSIADVLRRTGDRLSRVLEKGASLFDAMPALAGEGLHRAGAPLVEVYFNYVRTPAPKVGGVEMLQAGTGYSDLDLMITVAPDLGHIRLDHNLDIIDRPRCAGLGRDYLELLTGLVTGRTEVSAPAIERRASPAGPRAPVALAATFALGDLPGLVERALNGDDGGTAVAEAPYHHVLASLQDPAGVFGRPSATAGVVLLRAADLTRFGSVTGELLSELSGEFPAALTSLADRIPVVVGFLPARSADDRLSRWERELASRLREHPGITVLTTADWSPVPDPFDAETDALAHLPFRPECQEAVAITLAGVLRAIQRPPPKVIAVDGDQTLWGGVAGEIGPAAVDLAGPRATLARRLLDWRDAGVLLVLISKNEESTVRAVLDRPESALGAEHFTVISTGWQPKVKRIIAAADRLGLGLDGFLFLDDDPAEISAMRSELPEVLSVTCPAADRLEAFLARLWPITPRAVTSEDAARAEFYRQEQARREARRWTTFADFLARSRLEVDIGPLSGATTERSVQLSRRTSQFNLRPVPLDEAALARWRRDGEVWTASARDRFGDYGQVGVLVIRTDGDELEVVAWMLSCRALGRGVEERLLRWLADRADALRCTAVRLIVERTSRNVPAQRLVAALAGVDTGGPRLEVTVPPSRLRDFRSWAGESIGDPGGAVSEPDDAASPGRRVDRRHEGELIEGELIEGDGRRLAGVVDPPARSGTGNAVVSPAVVRDDRPWDADELASAIATRAGRFLGGAAVGLDTDFFDAGGTSVHAVELIATLARELGVRLELDDVFLDARPRRLARRWLEAEPAPAAAAPPASRGQAVSASDDDLRQILADVARADDLPWTGAPEPIPPRRILLTGATGFLGGHLLLDLLRRGDAHVVCLVRADDEDQGERRLADALARFDLPWSAEVRRRVTVLPGDIRQPRLGLAGDRWEALTREVDSIVGVAAAVDFVRGYSSLRQTNVLGPLTLAELATTGRTKPLHHISSTAVFNEIGIAAIGEDAPLARADRLATGYDRSKWAAEVALRRAREHGLTVTVLRPGGIGGHTKTGAHNPQDLGAGLLSAFVRLRAVPAFRFVNVAPVDWVSRVAAAVVYEPGGWGTTYNLTGRPNTLDGVVRDMGRGGMNVRVLGWDEWRAAFLARMETEPVAELDFMVRLLRDPTAVKLCEATLFGPEATGERAEAFVAAHGLPAPAPYGAQAQLKTLERLVDDGLARLPGRDDPPYLWFHETMAGALGPHDGTPDTPCALSMTLSIAGMYQLATERRVDVRGELTCARLHPDPLTVETGDIWIRPEDGTPRRHGPGHPLLRYRLLLRDRDGRAWWLEGLKTARPRRDLWQQSRTLTIEAGREGEPASLAGEVVVPADGYVREQIDGIRVDPRLSSGEQRAAKLMWLGWFGAQVGWGLLEPALRAGADLLDQFREGGR